MFHTNENKLKKKKTVPASVLPEVRYTMKSSLAYDVIAARYKVLLNNIRRQSFVYQTNPVGIELLYDRAIFV